MKNKPTKRPRKTLKEEQILFVFVRRMEDLQAKKYFQELQKIVDFSKPPSDWDLVRVTGDPTKTSTSVMEAIKDEEVLISFLATFRQFYLNDEPIALANVKGILRGKAKLFESIGDPSLMAEFNTLHQKHKTRPSETFGVEVTDTQGRALERLDRTDLMNVFLYGKYFHSNDYVALRFHIELPEECVRLSRAAFEYNLRYEVAELIDWLGLIKRRGIQN